MPIAVAGAAEQRQCIGNVINPAREKSDMVERGTERVHPGARNSSEAGFEADDPIESRRPDHRAQRLRAQRQRNNSRCHGGRGARGRTARRMRRVPGIDRGSGIAPGEFGRNRLAEYCGAEIAQPLHHPGVGIGNVALIDRRSVGGRHVRSGDDILDRDWNARQRPVLPRCVDRKNFERAQHGLDGVCPLEAVRRVAISGGLILREQAQQFENPRAGFGAGTRDRFGHVGKSRKLSRGGD